MKYTSEYRSWISACVIGVVLWASWAVAQPPERGLSLPCNVVQVYDGDTVTVDVTIRCRVRLIDCWAPELREAGGRESQKHLAQMALGKSGTLYIPTAEARHVGELFSFDRIVGRVWIDGELIDLSQRMVAEGHATKTRSPPTPKKPERN